MVHTDPIHNRERIESSRTNQREFELHLCPVGSISLIPSRYEIEGPDRATRRLLIVAALYLAQGIPWGFATITLAALLAEQGVDAGTIGNILAAVVLPWSLKFIGGMLVDGIRLPGGRRRPWILMAQIGMMATLFGLSREGLGSPDQLTAWLLAHNVFAALQDVATDALAVDVMPDRERGRANGIMYGAKYGGTALGGAGLALLIQDFCIGRWAHLSKQAWWGRLEHSPCFFVNPTAINRLNLQPKTGPVPSASCCANAHSGGHWRCA